MWVSLASLVTLLAGLLLVFAFGRFTAATWNPWCIAVAAVGGAYLTANVVSKRGK